MAWHNVYGVWGEEKVYRYLVDRGYTVLERNWRSGRRELDLIFLDEEVLVVAEVKTRLSAEVAPEEMISRSKRKNLLSAGAHYLALSGQEREIRFDLLLLTGVEMTIRHIQNVITVFD